MRAHYDSEAKAIQIDLADDRPIVAHQEDVGHGSSVGLGVDGLPVEIEILGADLGIEEPLDAAAAAYSLDRQALEAAARAALAAPDRAVAIEVTATLSP